MVKEYNHNKRNKIIDQQIEQIQEWSNEDEQESESEDK